LDLHVLSEIAPSVAILGLVALDLWRTKCAVADHEFYRDSGRSWAQMHDALMEAYRKESDAAISRLLIIAEAGAIMRRHGLSEQAERLMQKAIEGKLGSAPSEERV
jgi:hypothetical protein